MKTLTTQVGGDHYKGVAIQHFTFCQRNSILWGLACVLKYVIRHGRKNGLEDLKKASHYLHMTMEEFMPDFYQQWTSTPREEAELNDLAWLDKEFGSLGDVEPRDFCIKNGYEGDLRAIVLLACATDWKIQTEGDNVVPVFLELDARINKLMRDCYPEG